MVRKVSPWGDRSASQDVWMVTTDNLWSDHTNVSAGGDMDRERRVRESMREHERERERETFDFLTNLPTKGIVSKQNMAIPSYVIHSTKKLNLKPGKPIKK